MASVRGGGASGGDGRVRRALAVRVLRVLTETTSCAVFAGGADGWRIRTVAVLVGGGLSTLSMKRNSLGLSDDSSKAICTADKVSGGGFSRKMRLHPAAFRAEACAVVECLSEAGS